VPEAGIFESAAQIANFLAVTTFEVEDADSHLWFIKELRALVDAALEAP
jgi:hypothetical protein